MRRSFAKLVLVLTSCAALAALAVVPGNSQAAERQELSLGAAAYEVDALAKAYPAGVPASEVRALLFRIAPAVKAYTPPPPVCPRFIGCGGYISGPTQPQPAARSEVAIVETLKALAKDAGVEGSRFPASRLATVAAALRGLANAE